MRLVDADILKEAFIVNTDRKGYLVADPEVIIDNAPTVEPEITDDDLRACMAESHHLGYELAEIKFKKPQGKWIKNEGRDLRDCFYTCSKCGRNINVICGETLADYPFCHCGADMRPKPNHLRDCENCVHHSDNGCEVWECEFEKRSDV